MHNKTEKMYACKQAIAISRPVIRKIIPKGIRKRPQKETAAHPKEDKILSKV